MNFQEGQVLLQRHDNLVAAQGGTGAAQMLKALGQSAANDLETKSEWIAGGPGGD